MDITIPDSWLREYLKTSATPEKLAESLSLCGPSVEKIEKVGSDSIYHIEITTNRVDSASVYGVAREAAAILPRFNIDTKLKRIQTDTPRHSFVKGVPYLTALVDPKLCPRFTAVLIKGVQIGPSPDWMASRLEASDIRAINNVVDISNYIMLGLGQPVHTFDYDKISGSKMVLRESKKGESITTLDGKRFDLPGGDIVIEDGAGRLIDLAGVMGGEASMIDGNTKNVLLFVQTYNPVNIRKTSMSLAQRTQAATIFEKGTDAELVAPAILLAMDLFEDICKGSSEKDILDIYPTPYKPIKVTVDEEFIQKRLGVEISKKDISNYINSLEFESVWKGKKLEVTPPSFRAKDITSEEDILEEIARIYGYHNLPSKIMDGAIPGEPPESIFSFETKVKNILVGLGGKEVYTLSLVPKEFVGTTALKLKNPLGIESEYLRTSLMPSLIPAAKDNKGASEEFHLFEMANIYIPKKGTLPEERMMLAGVFSGYDYREAKGIVEDLLKLCKVSGSFEAEDTPGFSASRAARIKSGSDEIGLIGITYDGYVYYEFEVERLMKSAKPIKFQEISKYPSQIEDLTFTLPPKTKIGEILKSISSVNRFVEKVEMGDVFENNYTFRISYHSSEKTLTNADVEKIRKEILSSVKNKFGGVVRA